jgi:DNA polymerase-3 subunit chi
MTEILFYHLHDQKLEGVLPTLLEKSFERDGKAVVQGALAHRGAAVNKQAAPCGTACRRSKRER